MTPVQMLVNVKNPRRFFKVSSFLLFGVTHVCAAGSFSVQRCAGVTKGDVQQSRKASEAGEDNVILKLTSTTSLFTVTV